MSTIILFFLRLYQRTFSPDHGFVSFRHPLGYCRFYPSCSEYAIQAIQEWGGLRGGVFAIQRLLRCHPWSRGGNDPVIQKSHDRTL